MIKTLKKRFIGIALISFAVAMLALVVVLNLFITFRFTDVLDYNLDHLMTFEVHGDTPPDPPNPLFRIFMNRFFVVYYDDSGDVTGSRLQFEMTLTEAEAISYANQAIENDGLRGWYNDFRYLKYEDGSGDNVVIFIDGEFFTYALSSFRTFSLIALGVTSIAVVLFLFLFANSAIKPTIESYELQKQFMTDASHELKTPLSVISANTELLRGTDKDNEWLISIQKQTRLLTSLINQIVRLSKMDESEIISHLEPINFSILVQDIVDDFQPVIWHNKLKLVTDIEDDIHINGEKQSITELIKILVDNAVKYCEPSGEIQIHVQQSKYISLDISNTFTDVDQIDFKKIFDRFYRMDRSRKSDGSFGLGLSIASSIARIHKGSITAFKKDNRTITFSLTFPMTHAHNV